MSKIDPKHLESPDNPQNDPTSPWSMEYWDNLKLSDLEEEVSQTARAVSRICSMPDSPTRQALLDMLVPSATKPRPNIPRHKRRNLVRLKRTLDRRWAKQWAKMGITL